MCTHTGVYIGDGSFLFLCVLSSCQSSLQSSRPGPLVTVDPLSVPISKQGKVTSPHLAVQEHGKTTAPSLHASMEKDCYNVVCQSMHK